jgi:ArsR family transcriptional regulator
MPMKESSWPPTANGVEQIFRGLADLTRLRILNLLSHGELCVCDLQFVLAAAQPNVSRHLTYLKHSRLVVDRREGTRMYYQLAPLPKAIRRPLCALLHAAFNSDASFSEDSRKLRRAIERGRCTASEWRPGSALARLVPAGASS